MKRYFIIILALIFFNSRHSFSQCSEDQIIKVLLFDLTQQDSSTVFVQRNKVLIHEYFLKCVMSELDSVSAIVGLDKNKLEKRVMDYVYKNSDIHFDKKLKNVKLVSKNRIEQIEKRNKKIVRKNRDGKNITEQLKMIIVFSDILSISDEYHFIYKEIGFQSYSNAKSLLLVKCNNDGVDVVRTFCWGQY